MTVQELFTKWGFKIDDAPLGKLEKSVDSLMGKVNTASVIVGGFAATLFGLAKFTADAGDEVLAMSQKLGISVESLQRLQFAAKLANMDSASFATGMKFLSKGLDEAKRGSGELKESFAKLKLDPKKFTSSEQALRALSDRFQAMPDGPAKTALALKIFSKSGADMIPLLNGGSKALDEAAAKADKYGIVLTQAQAEAGDAFNDSLDETKAALTGVRNILGNALIPVIKKYLDFFNDVISSNRELIATKIQAFFATFGRVLEIVYKAGTKAVGLITRMVDSLGGMGSILDSINKGLDFVLGNDQFLAILGATTVALYALAGGFATVNAAALIIPLAIAGIIAAVALLADDLIAYGQGRESAFGLLINFFKKEFPTLTGFVSGAVDGMVAAFKIFFNVLSVVYNMLKTIGSYIVDVLVSAFNGISKSIQFLADKLGITKLLSDVGNSFKSAGGIVVNGLQAGASATGELAQNYGGLGSMGGPSSSPALGSSMSSSQNINAPVNFTINVPPGTDPAQVSQAASSGVHDGLGRALREAKRTSKPAVKY